MAVQRRDVLALVALVVIAGGLATGATYAARAAGDDDSTSPVMVTVAPTETLTTAVPITKTVTQTVTKTPNGVPATTFGNGVFEVGFDVQAGRYHTEGPEAGVRNGCVWKRSRPGGQVIAQGTAIGPLSVNVREGELMTTTGCRQWTLG